MGGMSGTSAGASGETGVDIGYFQKGQNRSSWPGIAVLRTAMPGHDDCRYYRFRRSDREFYFFAGAILASFAASGLASPFVALSSGLSVRSTLAVSRSFAT